MPDITLRLRSMLYAPGSSAALLEKVFRTPADSVIFDLEDAVPISAKSEARELIERAISEHRSSEKPIFVRVNPDSRTMAEDLSAAVVDGLTGIKLPKVESVDQVREAHEVIGGLESRHGLPHGSVCLIPSIETAIGLHHSLDIAGASTRVWCLSFGAVDYALDTGSALTPSGGEALFARSMIVVNSRVAGLAPPFDSVYPNLEDRDGLTLSASLAKSLGYQGKAVIHPTQIGLVHQVFTPSDQEIAEARTVLLEFDRAEQSGRAAFSLDGVMIDYASRKRAQSVLTLAGGLHSGVQRIDNGR